MSEFLRALIIMALGISGVVGAVSCSRQLPSWLFWSCFGAGLALFGFGYATYRQRLDEDEQNRIRRGW